MFRCFDAVNYGQFHFVHGSATVHTREPREALLASVDVPDLGFPWIPVPFGIVWGRSLANKNADFAKSSSALGWLSVLDVNSTENTAYGIGAAEGSTQDTQSLVLPSSSATTTSTSSKKPEPVTGPMTLGLYGSKWLGSDAYLFLEQASRFYVFVAPSK